MNLLVVFALLAIIALTLCIFTCRRISSRRDMRAARMTRCLDLAIRAEAALHPGGIHLGNAL